MMKYYVYKTEQIHASIKFNKNYLNQLPLHTYTQTEYRLWVHMTYSEFTIEKNSYRYGPNEIIYSSMLHMTMYVYINTTIHTHTA